MVFKHKDKTAVVVPRQLDNSLNRHMATRYWLLTRDGLRSNVTYLVGVAD
jgi:hypothetical protein